MPAAARGPHLDAAAGRVPPRRRRPGRGAEAAAADLARRRAVDSVGLRLAVRPRPLRQRLRHRHRSRWRGVPRSGGARRRRAGHRPIRWRPGGRLPGRGHRVRPRAGLARAAVRRPGAGRRAVAAGVRRLVGRRLPVGAAVRARLLRLRGGPNRAPEEHRAHRRPGPGRPLQGPVQGRGRQPRRPGDRQRLGLHDGRGPGVDDAVPGDDEVRRGRRGALLRRPGGPDRRGGLHRVDHLRQRHAAEPAAARDEPRAGDRPPRGGPDRGAPPAAVRQAQHRRAAADGPGVPFTDAARAGRRPGARAQRGAGTGQPRPVHPRADRRVRRGVRPDPGAGGDAGRRARGERRRAHRGRPDDGPRW